MENKRLIDVSMNEIIAAIVLPQFAEIRTNYSEKSKTIAQTGTAVADTMRLPEPLDAANKLFKAIFNIVSR